MKDKNPSRLKDLYQEEKESVTIVLRADLARAFRRCVWICVNETGRSPYEVQNELIEDLLRRHGC